MLSTETFHCLATGGYGYSYVFSVNIWRASGWGKLMQEAVLQLNIVKYFLCKAYVHVYELDESIYGTKLEIRVALWGYCRKD